MVQFVHFLLARLKIYVLTNRCKRSSQHIDDRQGILQLLLSQTVRDVFGHYYDVVPLSDITACTLTVKRTQSFRTWKTILSQMLKTFGLYILAKTFH